jgi:hypothetical protein
MNIESQRFGTLEINDDEILSFPEGVIGFPNEQRFVRTCRWWRLPKQPASRVPTRPWP